jgi:hypothetical protein
LIGSFWQKMASQVGNDLLYSKQSSDSPEKTQSQTDCSRVRKTAGGQENIPNQEVVSYNLRGLVETNEEAQ